LLPWLIPRHKNDQMKWCVYILLTLLAAAAWPALAAPAGTVSTDTNAQVMSIFIMPSSPSEGRDPFFPNSTRPYEETISKRPVELTSLEIKGFSEINGRRYVIINNHTFAAGDEGDVITGEGRIHIRCLTVGADSVLVESNGARHLLKFSDQ
jgi:hypothetical protein